MLDFYEKVTSAPCSKFLIYIKAVDRVGGLLNCSVFNFCYNLLDS